MLTCNQKNMLIYAFESTFVLDHKSFVEWQVNSVHAKLPGLRSLVGPRFWIVPNQICGYQCATWLVHKHHLQSQAAVYYRCLVQQHGLHSVLFQRKSISMLLYKHDITWQTVEAQLSPLFSQTQCSWARLVEMVTSLKKGMFRTGTAS